MDQKLIKAVITITDTKPIVKGEEVIGKTLIAEDGKKYGMFFKISTGEKTGQESVAWTSYQAGNYDKGSRIGISYASKPKEFTNPTGKLIKYEQRTIRMIDKAESIEYQQQNLADAPKIRNFDAENLGKCRYGFLIEAWKMKLTLDQNLLDTANVWAEASMTGEISKKEPTIQLEDGDKEIQIEDIPF